MNDWAAKKNNTVKHKRKYLAGVCAVFLVSFAVYACGIKQEELGAGGVAPTPTSVDMSAMGIDTKTVAHSTWVATSPHSGYVCNDCHSVDNDKICAQSGCHPFSKYSALNTNFDHTANKTGDHCNKCHAMTPEPTATDTVRIAGWR